MRNRGGPVAGLLIGALVATTSVGAVIATPAPVAAAPGTPGVMQTPTVAWYEDFSNVTTPQSQAFVNTLIPGPDETPVTPGYTSTSGDAYTQSPQYALGSGCNGLLLQAQTAVSLGTGNDTAAPAVSVLGACGPSNNWNRYRYMAAHTGTWQRQASYPYAAEIPSAGSGLANYIVSVPGSDSTAAGTLFETPATIPTQAGHYYQGSIDFATMTCQNTGYYGLDPQITLTQGGVGTSTFSDVPDTCRDGIGVQAGNGNDNRMTRARTFVGDTAVLSDGSPLSYRLDQTEQILDVNSPAGSANGAFDNPVVVDTTPQLDKEFAQRVHTPGLPVRLTFTVTNTHSPGQPTVPSGPKKGWSFDDKLPGDLVVAPIPNATTDCDSGSISGTGGVVSGTGNLSGSSIEGCTLSIDVVSAVGGTFTNAADDVTVVGLQLPADADVTYSDGAFCPPEATLWQSATVNAGTAVQSVNLFSGEDSVIGDLGGVTVNAVGFNELDGFYYAMRRDFLTTGTSPLDVIGVSSDLTSVIELGKIDLSLSPFNESHFSNGLVAGDVSPDGFYYIRDGVSFRWLKVDVRPGSADYLKAVDWGTANGPANWNTGADWVYYNGLLYSVGSHTTNHSAGIFAVNPDGPNGAVFQFGLGRLRAPDLSYTQRGNYDGNQNTAGATYLDSVGNVYASFNGSGHIWRVDLTGSRAADFVATGPAATNNDGARCASAVVEADFADAPHTASAPLTHQYTTTLNQGGPFHGIVRDTNGEPNLMLGASVTAGRDGQPGVGASLDDDDAFAADPVIVASVGEDVSVQVPVSNTSGDEATVVGWIDFDRNGKFEDNERAFVSAGATSDTVTLTWTAPNDTVLLDTYMRLRVSTEPESAMPSNTAANGGGVKDGEVEDWAVTLTPPPFECPSDGFLLQGNPLDVFAVDLGSGQTEEIFSNVYAALNAAGFNPLDGYIYGIDDARRTVRMGSDGSFTSLGVAVNTTGVSLPTTAWNSGDIDANGQLWITRGNFANTQVARIDLDPASPTFNTLVQASSASLPAGIQNISDWAFDIVSGNLYALGPRANGTFDLIEFDTAAGNFSVVASMGSMTAPNGVPAGRLNGAFQAGFGAVYSDPDGYLYGSSNTTGQIWRVDVATGEASFLAYGPASSLNDGARCATAPVFLDFGDAPAGFPVSLAEDGARHSLRDFDEGNSYAPLMIGTSVDSEIDGENSVAADADDARDEADEDGIAPGTYYPDDFSTFSLDIAVTNETGGAATLAAWLDLDNSGTFEPGERVVVSVPDGATSVTVPFGAPSVDEDSIALRLRLYPGTVAAPAIAGAARGGEVEDHLLEPTPKVPELDITKTVVGGAAVVEPGDTVTYQVEIENVGNGDYTEADPAKIIDDLSGVLDDADWGFDVDVVSDSTVSDGATVYRDVAKEFEWSGPLAAGEGVVLTYAVVVGTPPTGDGELVNVVVGPPGSNCGPFSPADPDCRTSSPIQGLEVVKTVAPASPVTPGTLLQYQITVRNVGNTVYVGAALADDLSDLAEDAVYQGDVDANIGTAAVAGDTLTWSGDLPPLETATITYSFMVNDEITGDGTLGNVVSAPGSECDPSGTLAPDCFTSTEVRALDVSKSADVTSVVPGGTVEYTVTVENTGSVAYADPSSSAVIEDDLTGVLAHSSLTGTPTAVQQGTTTSVGTLTIPDESAGETGLVWTGPLAPGEVVEIAYSVEVDDPVAAGITLVNAVTGPPETACDDCTVTVPVRQMTLAKSVNVTEAAPGDTVTYTVDVVNTGTAEFSAATELATLSDDMSGIFTNASFGEIVSATGTVLADRTGEVVPSASPDQGITWTGPLDVGESVRIVYTVVVNDDVVAPGTLINALVLPPGASCTDCGTATPLRSFTIDKQASVAEVLPGEDVTYTITLENTGAIDYVLPASPASMTDDLSDVLAYSTLVGTPTAIDADTSAPVGTVDAPNAGLGDTDLSWTGPLAAGQRIVISYTVTVKDPVPPGAVLVNSVTGPPESVCDVTCSTTTPVRSLGIEKSASVAEITAGGIIEYTVEITNTGGIEYTDPGSTAVVTDDLSDVLQNATYQGLSSATGDVTGDRAGEVTEPTTGSDNLVWQGGLAVGETVTLVYSVQVNDPVDSTAVLANTVTGPPESTCADGCTVTVPERALAVVKSADVSEVIPGGTVTYTITVENTGSVAYTDPELPARIEDNLAGVLAHSTLTGTPTALLQGTGANVGTLSVPDEVAGETSLVWSGPLDPGDVVEITYSVVVDASVVDGASLVNAVTGPPESACTECVTSTPIRQMVMRKSADLAEALPGDTVTYTVAITNSGAADYEAGSAPASIADDLSGVLANASFGEVTRAEDGGGADRRAEVLAPTDAGGALATLTWEGPLAVGETVTISYTLVVNSNEALTAPATLTNVVSGPPEATCDPTCTTDTPIRSLDVTKTVTSTGQAAAGGQVSYQLVITNTGGAPYAAPDTLATVTDNLADVLADAAFGTVVSAIGTTTVDRVGEVTAPAGGGTELAWTGELAIGETVTITYTVDIDQTLSATSDGTLVNSVTGPPESSCVTGAQPGCTTSTDVAALEIAKEANVTEVTPGASVEYTVTVRNTGAADYTAGAPAAIRDDMAELLADATFDGLVSAQDSNGANRAGEVTEPDPGAAAPGDTELTWTGPLAAGDFVKVTYAVTINDPLDGEANPTNTVFGPPESNCEAGCSVTLPDRQLQITKSVDVTETAPGSIVTYEVLVENIGEADYLLPGTPATITDDLTDVVDDSQVQQVRAIDSTGGDRAAELSAAANSITWSGPLLSGQSVTITYSVLVDTAVTAGATLNNVVTGPPESTCIDGCETTTPVRSLTMEKMASAGEVLAGETLQYTVVIANTGSVAYTAADALATATDDLTDVLANAEFVSLDTAGAAAGDLARAPEVTVPSATSRQLQWEGELGIGETVTLQYTVRVLDEVTVGAELTNSVVGPPETTCIDGCTTTTPVRALDIVKSTTTSGILTAGGDITYRLRITNIGTVDYVAPGTPATVTDDLSDVLADGAVGTVTAVDSTGADRIGQVSMNGAELVWSGSLAAGVYVDVIYVVTLANPLSSGSDGVIVNSVTGPPESPCDTGSESGCTTSTPVRALDVVKAADVDTVVAGGVINYTVTVTNTGGVDYTASSPARITDDLGDVLADAAFQPGSTATVSVAGDRDAELQLPDASSDELVWEGPLVVGESVTIAYTVVVNDPIAPDAVLANTVFGPPESPCDVGCTVTVPDRQFTIDKSVDAAEAVPGQVLTYTISVENTGDVDYAAPEPLASVTDDLADVLADAVFGQIVSVTGDAGSRVGEAALAGNTLTWTGPLAADEVVTIVYTVTVKDSLSATTDGMLVNVVTGPPESTCVDDCSTSTPVRALEVSKFVDQTQVAPGDTLTYTVLVENNGGVDYNAASPARIEDDLTDVLDVAEWGGVLSLSDEGGAHPTSEVTEPTSGTPSLVWEGPLATGNSLTLVYTVTVPADASGDVTLVNSVTGPPESTCIDSCTTSTPLRALEIVKQADVTETVPGGTVNYTLTITNTGAVDYVLPADPAVVTDDLSAVLTHATLANIAATDSEGANRLAEVATSASALTWTGSLVAGHTVTIEYAVTVDAEVVDNATLVNTVSGPPESTCDHCTTATPVRQLEMAKRVSLAVAAPGDTVTYTLTLTNSGAIAYDGATPAYFEDDLAEVLAYTENFDLVSAVATDAGDVSADVDVDLAGQKLSWSGELGVGETLTLMYSVDVPDPVAAGAILVNSVTGPPESTCVDGDETGCATTTPVRSLTIDKQASVAEVLVGEELTYTVTVTNTGGADYAVPGPLATMSDDLSDVLADANLVAASALDSDGANRTSQVRLADTTLTWTGPLAAGQSVDVTYTVRVDDVLQVSSDGVLDNSVTGPPETTCVTCVTSTPVRAMTIMKTVDTDEVTPGATMMYTIEVTNVGGAAYDATHLATLTDDMSDLLTDADFGSVTSLEGSDSGTRTVADEITQVGDTLEWAGPLAVGETVTIQYWVVVSTPLSPGSDGILANTVTGPPESNCADGCTVTVPGRQLTLGKSVDVASVVPGATVHYTVTVTNSGSQPYTSALPATITDDLSDVLADAAYGGLVSASAVTTGGTTTNRDSEVTESGTVLTWTGALEPGEVLELVYAVTVNDALSPVSDGVLVNSLQGPPEATCDPTCATATPVRTALLEKSVSVANAAPGELVHYSVTVTNSGGVDYTRAAPLKIVDDLGGVLAHAAWVSLDSAVDSDGANRIGEVTTPSGGGTDIYWTGPLSVKDSLAITYTVRVKDPGDPGAIMVNTVSGPPEAACVDECRTVTPIRSLAIAKSVDVDETAPGGGVTYTVTVTNTGAVDYLVPALPASFEDDLSDVLSDATFVEVVSARDGADADRSGEVTPPSATAPQLSWTGPLAIDDTVTLVYRVTVNDTLSSVSDGILTNVVTGPPESNCDAGDEPGCGTATPVRSMSIDKVADVDETALGGTVNYTLTIRNTGAVAYLDTTVRDDLSDVLAGADEVILTDAIDSNAVSRVGEVAMSDVTGSTLTWVGDLAVGQSLIITYAVTVSDTVSDDAVLSNSVTGPPTSNCVVSDEPGCSTDTPVRALALSKVASVAQATAGDAVTYTVTIQNIGGISYDAAAPALVNDDLAGVLDFAAFGGLDSAVGSVVADRAGEITEPTDAAPTLRWEGELAVGETVTLIYTVTVDDPVADGAVLVNAVTAPAGFTCVAECATTTPVRGLAIAKSAAVSSVSPGGLVRYTVAITNTGGAVYPSEAPARIEDNLADVLQDATFVGLDSATGSVTADRAGEIAEPNVDAPTLVWEGPLAVGETVTVVYSVTVKDAVADGTTLSNSVSGPPESTCANGDESGCQTETPVKGLSIIKTRNDVADIAATGLVRYRVEVINTGGADYTTTEPAIVKDDLSAMIDDADLVATPGPVTEPAGVGGFDLNASGDTLTWSGPIDSGDTVTLVYEFELVDGQGDGEMVNTVTGPPESTCPEGQTPGDGCRVDIPQRQVNIVKSTTTTEASPGDEVTYELTVTNPSPVPFGVASPANVVDDLSGVLDYATWVGFDVPTQGVLEHLVGERKLQWNGELDPGAEVVLRYTVRLHDTIPAGVSLVNTVLGQPVSNCVVANDQLPAECVNELPIRQLHIDKRATVTDWIGPHQVQQYTVTVTNTGTVDYTADAPAQITDDLSGVLDDAELEGTPVASTGTVGVSGDTLTWSGTLVAGESVAVTYEVRVLDPPPSGARLDNVVSGPPESNCDPGVAPGAGCSTVTPIRALGIKKTSDAGATVDPSDTVHYTVDVTNTGTYPYAGADLARISDDLSDVLDDATYADDATATSGTVTVTVAGRQLSWSGTLEPGETATIEYSVTVKDPATGNAQLNNTVTGPPESVCAVNSSMSAPRMSPFPLPVLLQEFNPACSTSTPVTGSSLEISKAVEAPGSVKAGNRVTYTVVATNVGQADYSESHPAVLIDDLSYVLDDSTLDSGATVDRDGGVLDISEPWIRWTGPLPVGDSVTLTYSVTVHAWGDSTLDNVAFDGSLSDCIEGEQCAPAPPVDTCADGDMANGLPCAMTVTPVVTPVVPGPEFTPPPAPGPDGPSGGLSGTGADVALAATISAILVALGGLIVLAVWRVRHGPDRVRRV